MFSIPVSTPVYGLLLRLVCRSYIFRLFPMLLASWISLRFA